MLFLQSSTRLGNSFWTPSRVIEVRMTCFCSCQRSARLSSVNGGERLLFLCENIMRRMEKSCHLLKVWFLPTTAHPFSSRLCSLLVFSLYTYMLAFAEGYPCFATIILPINGLRDSRDKLNGWAVRGFSKIDQGYWSSHLLPAVMFQFPRVGVCMQSEHWCFLIYSEYTQHEGLNDRLESCLTYNWVSQNMKMQRMVGLVFFINSFVNTTQCSGVQKFLAESQWEFAVYDLWFLVGF